MPIAWWVVLALSWTIALLAAWGAYRLFIRNGRLLLKLRELHGHLQSPLLPGLFGLPAGCVLHDFDLPDLSGNRVTLSQWQGHRVLLIYLDPACAFSQAMLPDLAAMLHRTLPGEVVPIAVSTGDPHRNRLLFEHHGIDCPVLVQEDMELADLHAVAGTPMAYLADEDGMTSEPPIVGAQAILQVLQGSAEAGRRESYGSQITRRFVRPRGESLVEYSGLQAGTQAPDFLLPGLEGEPLSLGERRQHPVLLLFLDPACLTCRQLLPDLERIHREATDLRLLIVSRGSFEANRALVAELGISIPVGIQRYWDTSRLYRIMATPAAFFIDQRGEITRDAALGRDAILLLLTDVVKEREVVAV